MDPVNNVKNHLHSNRQTYGISSVVLLTIGIFAKQRWWQRVTFGAGALTLTACCLAYRETNYAPSPEEALSTVKDFLSAPAEKMEGFFTNRDYLAIDQILTAAETINRLDEVMTPLLLVTTYEQFENLARYIPKHFNEDTLKRAVAIHWERWREQTRSTALQLFFDSGYLIHFKGSPHEDEIRNACYEHIVSLGQLFFFELEEKTSYATAIVDHEIFPKDFRQGIMDHIWLAELRGHMYYDSPEQKKDFIDLLNARDFTDAHEAVNQGYQTLAYLNAEDELKGRNAVDLDQAEDIFQLLVWCRGEAISEKQVRERVNRFGNNLIALLEFGLPAIEYSDHKDALLRKGLELLIKFPMAGGSLNYIRIIKEEKLVPPQAVKLVEDFQSHWLAVPHNARMEDPTVDIRTIEKIRADLITKFKNEAQHLLTQLAK